MSNLQLYLCAVVISGLLSLLLTPAVRFLALRLGWLDTPSSHVKTHKVATPSLGGIAIWFSFTATLVAMRFMTQFPTGTLRSLRAILLGGAMVSLLGVVDDLKKPQGLHFKPKFVVQLLAAAILLYFGIQMRFIQPDYLAVGLTLLWVVGISNALNIIDIVDGLCASQAAIAALAFLCIALPSEEIYVNFASAALLGAALGFLPWNFSDDYKIFMGDSGSLFLGFVLAAIALGTNYTRTNPLGVYAPLFILLVPMYDTFFVMAVRLLKGHSPFMGSKDHFALRLERVGFLRHHVVGLAALCSGFLSLCAFLVTRVGTAWALWIYGVVCAYIAILSWRLYKIEMK